MTSREKESGSQAPKREQGTQARAASTPTAETAGAAAAGDVGADGEASAVAELDNPSARTHAGAPDDVRGATLGKKERERAHTRPRYLDLDGGERRHRRHTRCRRRWGRVRRR